MSLLQIVLALVAIFATHWLGCIGSYGSTLLALPLLLWITSDLDTARLSLLIVGTVQAYHVFYLLWRDTDWRELGRMVLIAGLGMPIGFAAAKFLPRDPLVAALGVILVLSGLSKMIRGRDGETWRPPAWVLWVLLFIGGIVHGAFGTGGATVVIYAQHTFTRKEPFRATLCTFWVVLNTPLIFGFFRMEPLTHDGWVLTLVGVPLVFLANWWANRVALRMSQQRFMVFVSILLVISGVVTVAKVVLT